MPRTVRLDDDQISIIRRHLPTMNFLGHYMTDGLFDSEVDFLNDLRKLNAILGGEPEPEPLPYLQTSRARQRREKPDA